MSRTPNPEGRKREIGTKLYPEQIDYIDRLAADMGITRYKLIQKALTEVFFSRSRPYY